MNGAHDMGGMQNMGPVRYEKNEPVFHARWEGRVMALNRLMGAWRKWTLDASRHQIELIPPAEYLRMSYYEKWHTRLVELLVNSGLVTRAEIESGKPAPGAPKASPKITAANIAKVLVLPNPERPKAPARARFKVGQRVRTRNMHPAGHTRLPMYARAKRGTIVRDHGIFVFPDTNAHFLGEKPQHVYSVRFRSRELWGEQAGARDSVYVDIWDDYLEQA
ncbi:MAG TPA: nitrile hydratase subunit beta [Bryobacteraceae bacterium]|jgi:nitrile hydratase subunit beta|nr:nitrile hydratase subunit beta [Bryobacteraceae bacterium]